MSETVIISSQEKLKPVKADKGKNSILTEGSNDVESEEVILGDLEEKLVKFIKDNVISDEELVKFKKGLLKNN